MATVEPQEEQEAVPRPPARSLGLETMPVYGVEPPWKLFSALRDLWRERQVRQRESRQPQ